MKTLHSVAYLVVNSVESRIEQSKLYFTDIHHTTLILFKTKSLRNADSFKNVVMRDFLNG